MKPRRPQIGTRRHQTGSDPSPPKSRSLALLTAAKDHHPMPRFSASPTRKFLIASALALGAARSAVIGLSLAGAPAHAQITVFDTCNSSPKLPPAARTTEQITKQVRSHQPDARTPPNHPTNTHRKHYT